MNDLTIFGDFDMKTQLSLALSIAVSSTFLCSNFAYATPVGTTSFAASNTFASSTNSTNTNAAEYDDSITFDGSTVSTQSTQGHASTYSESNLSAGTLRASSSVTEYSRAADGSGRTNAVSTASFGDSFTHVNSNNQPFLFTNNQQSTFSLDVSGVYNASISHQNVQSEAYLSVFILNPGTLATYTADDGSISYVDENFNGILHNDLISHGVYGLTPNSDFALNYAATGGPNSTDADNPDSFVPVDGYLSDGDTLNFTFSPEGDFDWVIELSTLAAINDEFFQSSLPSGVHQAITDFSNTINASYTGPNGATTVSASGLFPGTASAITPSAVPVPAALPLMASALGMFGIARRKKASA